MVKGSRVLTLRVSEDEAEQIQVKADKYANGNVSALIRYLLLERKHDIKKKLKKVKKSPRVF